MNPRGRLESAETHMNRIDDRRRRQIGFIGTMVRVVLGFGRLRGAPAEARSSAPLGSRQGAAQVGANIRET